LDGTSRVRLFVAAAAILLAMPYGLSEADDLTASDKAGEQQQREGLRSLRLKKMKAAAARYRLYSTSDRREPLSLVDEPVQRFTNPVNVAKDGAVFLWTDHGRPAAVVQFYTFDELHFSHEWQSLSAGPLTAESGGAIIWAPREAGLSMRELHDAEAPADGGAARLRQMRNLAERFTAAFRPFVAAESDAPVELRLLPRAIYRYESAESGLVDGAMFAFVQGTDPQVLLLLEARRDGESLKWQYGLARMASGAVSARYQGKEIWTEPKYDFKADPTKSFLVLPKQPAPDL
jgi:hypothetical protein